MEPKTVDIRELGAQLEQHLEDVKAGATLVITDQGKPVARILPTDASIQDKLRHLAETGVISWSGRKLSSDIPTFTVRGSKTASEMLLEDRD